MNILMDSDAAGVDLTLWPEISALVDVFPQAATIRSHLHPLDCIHCYVHTSFPANVLGYVDEAYLEFLSWIVDASRGNKAHDAQKIIENDVNNNNNAK